MGAAGTASRPKLKRSLVLWMATAMPRLDAAVRPATLAVRMTRLLQSLGADVERALTDMNVPSYVIDRDGAIVWLNPAAQRLVGDARGRRFTDIVVPADRPRARETFARKIVGKEKVTDAEVELVGRDGRPLSVEVSSVPLHEGHQVVGVFGLLSRPPALTTRQRLHANLTPRQREVLRMLSQGSSTKQIAEDLHLSTETVRNHVRGILQALDVHSRVEAVAAARARGLIDD